MSHFFNKIYHLPTSGYINYRLEKEFGDSSEIYKKVSRLFANARVEIPSTNIRADDLRRQPKNIPDIQNYVKEKVCEIGKSEGMDAAEVAKVGEKVAPVLQELLTEEVIEGGDIKLSVIQEE